MTDSAPSGGGSRLPGALLAVAGCVFVTSATLKAVEPSSLEPLLRFAGASPGLRGTLTLWLIGLEGALGVSLLAYRARALGSIALGLTAAFTGILGVLLSAAEPPGCGCFGALRIFDSARTELLFAIGRNLLLAGMLVAAIAPSGRAAPVAPGRDDASPAGA